MPIEKLDPQTGKMAAVADIPVELQNYKPRAVQLKEAQDAIEVLQVQFNDLAARVAALEALTQQK